MVSYKAKVKHLEAALINAKNAIENNSIEHAIAIINGALAPEVTHGA